MPGFSPALPFHMNSEDGIALTKTMMDVIKQNFKNLVLTNPGERVMIPEFGVGIKRFLFELNNQETLGRVKSRISDQAKKYLPYISISDIKTISDPDMFDAGAVNIKILYSVSSLDYSDILDLHL